MKLKTMAEMLNAPNIKLISLQYGDDGDVVEDTANRAILR